MFDDYRMTDTEYRSTVRQNSVTLYKQKAKQCSTCNGTGQIRKVKKDGTPFARTNKCGSCDGVGYLFMDIVSSVAGLKFNAPTSKWASANGFATSKDKLEYLEGVARQRDMQDAVLFLKRVRRLSAVDT